MSCFFDSQCILGCLHFTAGCTTGCATGCTTCLIQPLFNPAFRGCQNLINGLCVSDIQVVPEHGRHHRRSSSYRTLAVPRTRKTLGDRSFAVAGPRVWNSLPATIRQITSYGQFKQRLKTHLFGAWKTWGRKTQHIVTLDYCVQYKFLLTYIDTSLLPSTEQRRVYRLSMNMCCGAEHYGNCVEPPSDWKQPPGRPNYT